MVDFDTGESLGDLWDKYVFFLLPVIIVLSITIGGLILYMLVKYLFEIP